VESNFRCACRWWFGVTFQIVWQDGQPIVLVADVSDRRAA
jgi:hypothetical protein